MSNRMRKLTAEAIGTFGLVFAGTGAIVINDVTPEQFREVRNLIETKVKELIQTL